MSFENAAIFPFPAVQYIPLQVRTKATGIIESGPGPSIPKLISGAAISKYAGLYRIDLPDHFPAATCPVLALHLQIDTARYRSFFITMIGRLAAGSYQLFTVSSDRFYKDKLFFEVFEEHSGRKLARYSLFVPQGSAL